MAGTIKKLTMPYECVQWFDVINTNNQFKTPLFPNLRQVLLSLVEEVNNVTEPQNLLLKFFLDNLLDYIPNRVVWLFY